MEPSICLRQMADANTHTPNGQAKGEKDVALQHNTHTQEGTHPHLKQSLELTFGHAWTTMPHQVDVGLRGATCA